MPIFDYQCRQCGHQFEQLVRHGSKPEPCPACHATDLEQLLSLPAISTEKSRKRTMGIARKAATEVKKEKDHAQREYERNYIKDHS
jgi:putative FmdB family regulatory protein